jgi:hypothetical protein
VNGGLLLAVAAYFLIRDSGVKTCEAVE